MKTHAEIDALYRAAVQHSHDAAIDAVYEAGAEDARTEVKTTMKTPPAPVSSLPAPSPTPTRPPLTT